MNKVKTAVLAFQFILSLLTISCRSKQSDKATFDNQKLPSKTSSLIIKPVDSAFFRRSYFGFENWSAEEAGFLKNRNPDLGEEINPKLYKTLNDLKVMRNDSLILSQFRDMDSFEMESIIDTLNVKLGYEQDGSGQFLEISNDTNSAKVVMTGYMPKLKVAFINLIPGSFKEIVLLRNIYIMDGDNYDIFIYQIVRQ